MKTCIYCERNNNRTLVQRIVKMEFRPEEVENFKSLFESVKDKIAAREGCQGVKLLQSGNIFFTYSLWEAPENLQAYRDSPLFEDTWIKTKALFTETRAEAWSTEVVDASE